MTDIRSFLIEGSEKVIAHYHFLLSRAETDSERELYQSRIRREEAIIDRLHGEVPERMAA